MPSVCVIASTAATRPSRLPKPLFGNMREDVKQDMSKKHIRSEDRIGLKLTQAERSLLLEGLTLMPSVFEDAVKGTPTKEPVMLTLDDLDALGGYVAAEANHTEDKRKGKKLDAVFQKIQKLLGTHTDEEPPRTISFDDAMNSKALTDNAVQVAEFAATALMAAESMGIKSKPLAHFYLSPAQREVLLAVPDISKSIKTRLKNDNASFTIAEVASMTMSLVETSIDGTPRQQVAALLVVNHLTERLQAGIPGLGESKPRKAKEPKIKADSHTIYQFKITLIGSKPPIWRRIQVADCTLDKLHQHIQTAMGWTNSHLHQFEIKGKRYGDPELIVDGFDDSNCVDSTRTRISKILPKTGKRFSFTYEYDFGDGWDHEILFEGCPQKEPRKRYPLCIEGERACPPEDVGGIGGFYEFLEALADPKHNQHDDFLEWGGEFESEKFDAQQATKEMKEGLPDWRLM